MTDDAPFRMSLHKHTYELRLRLDRRLVESGAQPPDAIWGKARLTLASLRSQNLIEDFELFPETLRRLWSVDTVRRTVDPPWVTLGVGYRLLPGLRLEPSLGDKALKATLSLPGEPAKLRQWPLAWLLVQIDRGLRELGVYGSVNPADVEAALLRAAWYGERVTEHPLELQDAIGDAGGASYRLRPQPRRQRVDVVLGPSNGADPAALHFQLMRDVERELAAMADSDESSGLYVLQTRNMLRTLTRWYSGPAKVGLTTPFSCVAGIVLPRARAVRRDVLGVGMVPERRRRWHRPLSGAGARARARSGHRRHLGARRRDRSRVLTGRALPVDPAAA